GGVVLQIQSLAMELPKHKEVIIEKVENLRDSGKGSWLDETYAAFKEIVDRTKGDGPYKGPKSEPVPVTVESTDYWPLFVSTGGPLVDLLVKGGLVMIRVLFMLIQREDLRNRLIRLSGTRSLTTTTRALDDTSSRISRFLLMQVLVNGTYGLALGIGLFF